MPAQDPAAPPPALAATRLALVAVLLGLLTACGRTSDARAPGAEGQPATHQSNLKRDDFIGSQACAKCHPLVYERWSHSPMHRMTRRSARGEVQAPFDGSEFRFRQDVARMLTRDGQKYMELRSAKYQHSWFRITKVIGGRFREDYAGVRVDRPERSAPPKGDERILPVSYLLFNKEWRYKGYSVLSPERSGLRRGLKWKTSCIFCHNTAPWLSLYYDELYGVGAPTYQGAASLILPSERRLEYKVSDLDQFQAVLAQESEFLGSEPAEADDLSDLLEQAADQTRARFSEQHLVEVGIGCEACHGGGRAHAEAPDRVLPSYVPEADFFQTTFQRRPVPKPLAMTHSCAKCHTVLFSHYPYTWEGGDRGFDAGGSSMNSGEARNFLLGNCNSELKCTTCHDPHAQDDPEALARLGTVAGNAICTRCHQALTTATALRRHTHHESDSEGSACLSCHMPKKNVGLDYDLTRYHRIGSPTDRARVEGDRPLECALCHADQSVRALVTRMEQWWHRKYNRQKLEQLYGKDLEVNALSATLERGKPHEQVVALFLSGTHKLDQNLDRVVGMFGHEYPLLRFFARDALERITGHPVQLDMHEPGAKLEASVRGVLASPPPTTTPTVETSGADDAIP